MIITWDKQCPGVTFEDGHGNNPKTIEIPDQSEIINNIPTVWNSSLNINSEVYLALADYWSDLHVLYDGASDKDDIQLTISMGDICEKGLPYGVISLRERIIGTGDRWKSADEWNSDAKALRRLAKLCDLKAKKEADIIGEK